MPYLYYYNAFWILIPALIIGMWAQSSIQSTYRKFSRIDNRMGMTGALMARRMLDAENLTHVRIERVGGTLTDHFDPREDVLRLSPAVHDGTSIASMCIAAHEAGHAIQADKQYAPYRWRTNLLPLAIGASQLFWLVLIIGFAISPTLVQVGIAMFAVGVLFQIITLPVEFDASRRAMERIRSIGSPDDVVRGSGQVLKAAAMTYVAAALMSISQLIRLMAINNQRN